MKKAFNLFFFLLTIFSFYSYGSNFMLNDMELLDEEFNNKIVKVKKENTKINNFKKFEFELAKKESKLKVDTVNVKTGCVGLFQFCENRAKDFGLTTTQIVKMSEKEQKKLFVKHVNNIKKQIGEKHLKELKNKGFSDGSIIAVAHLGGVKGLKKYAKLTGFNIGNYNPNDGYTSLSDYEKKFKKFDGFLN